MTKNRKKHRYTLLVAEMGNWKVEIDTDKKLLAWLVAKVTR